MISLEELRHLATLSRIELDPSDEQSLLKEFDSILNYIDQLKKTPIKSPKDGRIGATKNVTRKDITHNSSPEDRERLLNAAPKRLGDYIAVPR